MAGPSTDGALMAVVRWNDTLLRGLDRSMESPLSTLIVAVLPRPSKRTHRAEDNEERTMMAGTSYEAGHTIRGHWIGDIRCYYFQQGDGQHNYLKAISYIFNVGGSIPGG